MTDRALALLGWYDRVKRPLLWRQDQDPYRVWLSEVMLQQTRVETAIPYYERFLEAFPSVERLASAADEEVRAAWSGLGYYRRARMLHEAAGEIVRRGGFPRTAAGWQRLPGVGPYTAAAVASIAYGERVLALDGNIERVLSRLEAYGGDPKSADGRRFLEDAGAAWIVAERPGDSNQALMELGATLCKPVKPACDACPLAVECSARELGTVEQFPVRARAARREARNLVAALVQRGDRVLLVRRRSDAKLLAGTWELPWVEAEEATPVEGLASALAERYGGTWRVNETLGRVRHAITFRDLSVSVRSCELRDQRAAAERGKARWASRDDLEALPHSSLLTKALALAP